VLYAPANNAEVSAFSMPVRVLRSTSSSSHDPRYRLQPAVKCTMAKKCDQVSDMCVPALQRHLHSPLHLQAQAPYPCLSVKSQCPLKVLVIGTSLSHCFTMRRSCWQACCNCSVSVVPLSQWTSYYSCSQTVPCLLILQHTFQVISQLAEVSYRSCPVFHTPCKGVPSPFALKLLSQ